MRRVEVSPHVFYERFDARAWRDVVTGSVENLADELVSSVDAPKSAAGTTLRSLSLQRVADHLPKLGTWFVLMSGNSMSNRRIEHLVLLSRNRERASALAREVPAIGDHTRSHLNVLLRPDRAFGLSILERRIAPRGEVVKAVSS